MGALMSYLDHPLFDLVVASLRDAASHELPANIQPHDSLVEDLGFDSLTISVLALELEQRLDRSVLMSRWVENIQDPSQLTVGSLCAHLESS